MTEEGVDQTAEMLKHSRATGSVYPIFTKVTIDNAIGATSPGSKYL
jgi:hypothetical protein